MTHTIEQPKTYQEFLELFHDYAATLLRIQDQEVKEALRRRQIASDNLPSLGDAYKISVKLGATVPLERIEQPLLQQLEAAAYFIKNFHIGVLGQRTSLFQLYEIEFVIDTNIKYSFSFEAGKLLIQIPSWKISVLNRYLPYEKIKTLWNRGKHLDKASPFRRAWWVFNPIGEFRSNLRAILLLAVQKQILGIDKLLVELGFADVGDRESLALKDASGEIEIKDRTLPSASRNALITFLKTTVNDEKLGINLDLVLKNQDDETLGRLLGLVKKNLADPGQIEEILDAGVLTLQEAIQEEQSKVDVKMFGFVNVGNYHRIDVALNLSSGYLKRYIELIPRKAELKAIQFGFVNVYTIDDITVKPNFHGAMKLNFETLALERALKELQLVG